MEQRLERVRPQLVIEKHPELTHRDRLLRANQRSFEDPFGIHRIHGSAIPGKVPRVATMAHQQQGAIKGCALQER
jgi:Flp pilus assembly CpaE family ATPase